MTAHSNHAEKLVFFGTDAFSVPSLVQLLAEHWQVVAVVTKPDAPTGRGRHITPPAVKRLAEAQGIPVYQPDRLEHISADLHALGADVGIVVAYGKLIPASMLELFPHGFINVHASLLPKYRGASPIEAAILNGDEETGVSLMRVEAGLDTGPTYDASKLQLDGTENREQLYERLAELGADLLSIRLPAILSGQVVPIPQAESEATEVGRIAKADGIISWIQPADVLERQIRAYLGWPGSRATIASTDVTITAAHVARETGPNGQSYRTDTGELAVYAGTGSLVIDQLKPAGRSQMTGQDFLRGRNL